MKLTKSMQICGDDLIYNDFYFEWKINWQYIYYVKEYDVIL